MCIPKRVIDITGQRFGRYTVIRYAGLSKDRKALWTCKCDCGTIKDVLGKDLRSGNTKSCGCYAIDLARRKNIPGKTTHGLTKHPLFSVWSDMKTRCYNKNNEYYDLYGGRGITVCDEWKSFETFYSWAIANGYHKKLTLDRIDSNGNYNPTNCRWVSMKVQQNNRRNNKYITIDGLTKTMSEWADFYGVDYMLARSRIRNGWDPKIAFTQQKHKPQTIIIDGEERTILAWSRISGVNNSTIADRLAHGWNNRDAVFTKPKRKVSFEGHI